MHPFLSKFFIFQFVIICDAPDEHIMMNTGATDRCRIDPADPALKSKIQGQGGAQLLI